MCGRYFFSENIDLTPYLRILNRKYDQLTLDLLCRGEVRPGQIALTADANDLYLMRWGYQANGRRLINSRFESLTTNPAYRCDYQQNRCVILASGFYEWRDEERYYLHTDEPLIYLAALYQKQSDFPGFSIITRSATSTRDLHPRIPLVLNRDQAYGYLRHELDQEALLAIQPDFRIINQSGNLKLF